MAKLLINDNNKVLVGSNGKAYAVNLDAASAQQYPFAFNAAAGRMLKLMRYGKCEQSVTPTPSAPVDIKCNNGALKYSANMANVNAQTVSVGYYISAQGIVTADSANWMYQDYIRVKSNTTYTLSMSQSVYFVSISEYSTAADSGFIIRKTGSMGSNTSLTITTGATTNFVRFGTNINRATVTLEAVLGINWMLVPGSSVVPYIPYVEGGTYIDGTPEVLTVSGKNIFDLATVGIGQGAIASSSGENSNSNYRVRTVGYVPVKPSTQYTISAVIDGYTSGSNRGVFVLEYSGKSADDYTRNSGWQTPNGYTFTTGAATNFVRIVFAKEPSSSSASPTIPEDVTNVQLEYGDTATAYEPYVQPQTASVEDILSVGDYKDEQDIISGLLTHKVGMQVFDGTENWGTSSSANIYILSSEIAVNLTAICTHFVKVSNTTSAANMRDGSFKGHSSNAVLYFKDESAGNVDGFKANLAAQYAAGTPVIVLYALDTPTVDEVTPQPLNTSSGQNTITDVAEVSNPELYIIHKI